MLKFIKLLVFLVLFFPLVSKADVCCPDDPDFDGAACTGSGGTVLATGCGGGGPAPEIPIDGGATAFAGLAVAYGINQLRKKKNK
ncbi:MAG: hypothetical protein EAZ31_04860 [Cytophagia bacterium]|nr:MAG: hypothetical protein EAZ31_04860 [Cytophagia bacterium]TAH28774.1 MAG: hypothetical protein EAZ06_08955 [Cytophagales bacterium]